MSDIIRFASVEMLIDRMPISNSVDHELLKSIMFTEQDTSIQNLIGTSLYENLSKEIDEDSIGGKRLVLIKKYLRPAMYHLATRSAALHSKYRFTDKGLVEQSDTNATQADAGALNHFKAHHLNKAQFYMNLAVKFICENSASFEDYDDISENGGVRPDRKPFFSGFQLG